MTTKAADLPPLDDSRSRFIILRDQLGRPPLDLTGVLRNMKNNALQKRQDESDTLSIVFGGPPNSDPFINDLSIKAMNKRGYVHDEDRESVDIDESINDALKDENDGSSISDSKVNSLKDNSIVNSDDSIVSNDDSIGNSGDSIEYPENDSGNDSISQDEEKVVESDSIKDQLLGQNREDSLYP